MDARLRYEPPEVIDRVRIAARLQTVSSSPDSPVWRPDPATDDAR